MEARGPTKHEERFDWDIAFHLQGPVVCQLLVRSKLCIQLFETKRG
jgi:hypothetical protein